MQKQLFDLAKEFNSNLNEGLNENQIIINQEKYGRNVLEEKKEKINVFKIFRTI